jgi:hypothetical protein
MALVAALWLSLPHGDSALDLLETVAPHAFTEPMNTGGTLTGVPLFAGSEASSWTQASYRLGNADITDPATGGRPLLYPDLSAIGNRPFPHVVWPIGEIQAKGAAHELATGAPGPVVTLVPGPGGVSWLGSAAVAASPSGLQADGSSATDPIARLHALGRVQGTASGRVAPRVRLFVAGAGTWSSHNERGEAFTLPGNVLSLVAHPTFDLSPDRRADATAWLQQTKTAFAARALLRDRNAAAAQWYGGVAGTLRTGVSRAVEVSGALASTHVTPEPAASAVRGTVERLTDDPIETLVNSTGGSRSRSSIAATLRTSSDVRVKGGVSLSHAAMETSPFGAGLIGETLDGMPARVWDYGLAGTSHRSETTFAIHGSAGTALLNNKFYLDVGLRLEHVGASARGAEGGIGWTSVEPRAALLYVYDNRWSGSITARRYHPVLPLAILSAGDPAAASGRSYLWTDRNGDRLPQDAERGTLVSLAGPGSLAPGFSTIDPALKRPFVDELQVAIDVRIKPSVALRFSGISRRGGDLLARYNTGVPFSAYAVRYVPDQGLNLGGPEDDQMLPIYSRPPATFGLDRYVLKTIPNVNSTYGGLYTTVLFDKSRWHVLAAATALHSYAPAAFRGYLPSQNDEMTVGDSYSDPNSNTYSEGRTLFDRGYGLKVSAAYSAPREITIAAAARYADGQNFARVVIVPDLPQGPDAIRAFANGKTKFTYTATLDLRVQKRVILMDHRVVLGMESYNTTNLRNEVEEYTVTGPRWRTPTFTQPPRVIRLTASVFF